MPTARPLPAPLPLRPRLDASFARSLRQVALAQDLDWALLLAALQTRGQVQAHPSLVQALARQLVALGAKHDPRTAAARLARHSAFVPGGIELEQSPRSFLAERVEALAAYNSAVGLEGLVQGRSAVEQKLVDRVLHTRSLEIYPGGRVDIAAERVDPRVLLLLLTLANRYDSVVVTSLVSGHGFYTKSGAVSAHSYGRAVDISALDGTPVLGDQRPGSKTESALRMILLLPQELRPAQLISLFDLGDPSFALADHHDHIHVGY